MQTTQIIHPIRLGDVPKSKGISFDVNFSGTELIAIADVLSAITVKKMRIQGKISPSGKKDWVLQAKVGATVVQTCVITLNPVQTRVDTPVTRKYVTDYVVNPDESVTEMTTDESIEPLVAEIDIAEIAIEAVALALPDYPKSHDAQLETAVFTEAGVTPMTDEDTKPFASLASLKDKLSKEDK
ncbi:MAG: DUF177 domain-containing protein [Proteobacteria bacterium]|nr:DUF177 domain-containing protein [Pseudomonadota bacterium]